MESNADLALTLFDNLSSQGDRTLARNLLELFEPVERDERISTTLADDALDRGDAPRALRLLARAWEAGSLNPYVESRLALAALAVGLVDVVEALTEPPARSADHAILRFILAASRGEEATLSGLSGPSEAVFGLRNHLRVLAQCGRYDLVDAVSHANAGLTGLQTALAGLPSAPPPSHELVRVPIEAAREGFTAAWRGPGGLAASNWAWAVAREIGEGERVLVLSPWPEAFRRPLSHAAVTFVAPTAAPGAQLLADPEHLPFAGGRFQHVVAGDWLGRALNPEAAMREFSRVLAHEGQLHALCAGPAAPGEDALTFAPQALQRLAARAGLTDYAVVARRPDGLPATGPEVAVALLRAVRRVI